MDAQEPEDFAHTTLKVYPESPIRDSEGKIVGWTPKRVGVTLLDESPGFTGVYLRDENGGLWPARTVNRSNRKHHKEVCDAWMRKEGINEDKRTVK